LWPFQRRVSNPSNRPCRERRIIERAMNPPCHTALDPRFLVARTTSVAAAGRPAFLAVTRTPSPVAV
jgi:hypothetical protein